MTKREKSKGPHVVREEPKPAEVAQDVAVGASLAPVDAEPPKFGLAVIDYHEAEAAAREMRQPVGVPLPEGVDSAGDAVRWVHDRIRSASDAETEAAVAEIRRRDDERLAAAQMVAAGRCTTCGNPVAPGATCAVDGQVAPS